MRLNDLFKFFCAYFFIKNSTKLTDCFGWWIHFFCFVSIYVYSGLCRCVWILCSQVFVWISVYRKPNHNGQYSRITCFSAFVNKENYLDSLLQWTKTEVNSCPEKHSPVNERRNVLINLTHHYEFGSSMQWYVSCVPQFGKFSIMANSTAYLIPKIPSC